MNHVIPTLRSCTSSTVRHLASVQPRKLGRRLCRPATDWGEGCSTEEGIDATLLTPTELELPRVQAGPVRPRTLRRRARHDVCRARSRRPPDPAHQPLLLPFPFHRLPFPLPSSPLPHPSPFLSSPVSCTAPCWYRSSSSHSLPLPSPRPSPPCSANAGMARSRSSSTSARAPSANKDSVRPPLPSLQLPTDGESARRRR